MNEPEPRDRAAVIGELESLLGKIGPAATGLEDQPHLLQHVRDQLPSEGFDLRLTGWEVVAAAARTREKSAGPRYLVAAKHLLALGKYPEDWAEDTGDKWIGEPLPSIHTSVVARRKLAVAASQIGFPLGSGDEGALRLHPSKGRDRLGEVAEALWHRVQELLYAPDFVERYGVATSTPVAAQLDRVISPPQPESVPSVAPPTPTTPWSSVRRHPVRSAAAVLCVVLIVLGLFVWPGWLNTPQASAQMKVTLEPRADTFDGEPFWIPVDAPLDTLPATDQYFCGGDGSTPRSAEQSALISWLKKYGDNEALPFKLTLTNDSTSTKLVTLTNLKARGTTSTPKPGFTFLCPSAKGGGPDYTVSKLDLGSTAPGVITSSLQPSELFWLGATEGQTQVLEVDLAGEKDFRGTVTADVGQIGSTTGTVTLPIRTGGKELVWHGVPKDKLLVVQPNEGDVDGFECSDPSSPAGTTYPCTLDMIKQKLNQLWGDGTVR